MQIEKISITLGATINTGNYENIRRDVTIVAALTEEDDDDLAYVRLDALTQAHLMLAESLISDLRVSFNIKGYWGLDGKESLRTRLSDNPIFKTIAAHAPTVADDLTDDFWDEYTHLRDKRIQEEAEKEAKREADRLEREVLLPSTDLVPDDEPEPGFDLSDPNDDEDTAEADYDDDFDDEEDGDEEEGLEKEYV